MNIFDQYFTFWDESLLEESSVDKLINLFADDVRVKSHEGEAKGKELLRAGILNALGNYISMKHLWHVETKGKGFEATWSVSHEMKNGHMHAAVGKDYLELNESGEIKLLVITHKDNLTVKIQN